MTERQKDVLEFIRQFHRQHGYAPTVREIGTNLGIKRNGVMSHLIAMEKNGAITRLSGRSRTIRIVGEQDGHSDKAQAVSVLKSIIDNGLAPEQDLAEELNKVIAILEKDS